MVVMLKKVERPRELKWYQAGALLYGDWGTSKAYVLGIAFALSGHASWFFLGLMSLLNALVGICYMTICRLFPDGGGVYSAVRSRSRFLAVIGAFLLIADYVVTASLSAVEAFHYFNFSNPELWAVGTLVIIGAINWLGPTKVGLVAAVIGVIASITAAVLFASTLPHLPHVDLRLPQGDWPKNWSTFVGIVLALSGVEAVANMTGIMQLPVEKTARKAILPVLLEVSVLTFLLGIAMNAIPNLHGHTEDMLRALGNHYIGRWYGAIVAIVFGFLLLSAANTAILALVNIQFVMAKDRELPNFYTKLNRFGMPWVALIGAVLLPVGVLLFEHDVVGLAALYAIGVVGAITLNVGTCATNMKLDIRIWERVMLCMAALILLFVEITIAFEKRNALVFVIFIISSGLTLRYLAKKFIPRVESVIIPNANVLTVSEAQEIAALYKSSSLVALKVFNPNLLEEAVLRAKALGESSIYLVYVEEIPPRADLPREIEPSEEALELIAKAEAELEKKGIVPIPIWQLGRNAGKMIALAATDLGVNTVLIGTTKRSALTALIRGDVLRTLAINLPRECHLEICG